MQLFNLFITIVTIRIPETVGAPFAKTGSLSKHRLLPRTGRGVGSGRLGRGSSSPSELVSSYEPSLGERPLGGYDQAIAEAAQLPRQPGYGYPTEENQPKSPPRDVVKASPGGSQFNPVPRESPNRAPLPGRDNLPSSLQKHYEKLEQSYLDVLFDKKVEGRKQEAIRAYAMVQFKKHNTPLPPELISLRDSAKHHSQVKARRVVWEKKHPGVPPPTSEDLRIEKNRWMRDYRARTKEDRKPAQRAKERAAQRTLVARAGHEGAREDVGDTSANIDPDRSVSVGVVSTKDVGTLMEPDLQDSRGLTLYSRENTEVSGELEKIFDSDKALHARLYIPSAPEVAQNPAAAQGLATQTNDAEKYIQAWKSAKNNATTVIWPFLEDMMFGTNSSLVIGAAWSIYAHLIPTQWSLVGPFYRGLTSLPTLNRNASVNGSISVNNVDWSYENLIINEILINLYSKAWYGALEALNKSNCLTTLDDLGNAITYYNKSLPFDDEEETKIGQFFRSHVRPIPDDELAKPDVTNAAIASNTLISGNFSIVNALILTSARDLFLNSTDTTASAV